MNTDLILAIGLLACVINIVILISRLNRQNEKISILIHRNYQVKWECHENQRMIKEYGLLLKSLDNVSASTRLDSINFMKKQNRINKTQLEYNKSFAKSIRGVANLARKDKK